MAESEVMAGAPLVTSRLVLAAGCVTFFLLSALFVLKKESGKRYEH